MHSRSVERLLKANGIEAQVILIDGDEEARENLMALNGGYASVPTILFPDGTQMTEPPLGAVRAKLGLESEGLIDRIKSVWQSK
jgi:mycoredoxin